MWYVTPNVNGLKQGHNRFSWQISKQYFKDFWQGNKTWIEIIHFAISIFFSKCTIIFRLGKKFIYNLDLNSQHSNSALFNMWVNWIIGSLHTYAS